MLDNETKRRIDTARDILVGKVPDPKSQVEQITIALIYKFMDDMDAAAEELGGHRSFFTGEFAKYGWSKLVAPGRGGFEVLNLYAEAITKMPENAGIPLLFRDIFKNAYLPYRDPETLKSFLKVIDDFNYDHSERLGDAFEYLLAVLGSQGDAGQFRTPRHIIDFMVQVIDPQKNESILDPACGTAGFLISSFKHIMNANSHNGRPGAALTPDERTRLMNQIKGYDISPDMVRLSLVNLYLHGFNDPHIVEYDTLTSEDRWNEYADIIMANPPFMSPKGGIRPHKRFSVQSNRSEVLFVDYMAEHLSPSGRAAIIVPEGVIFQSGNAYKQLRKMLVEKYLVGVISLPAGVFNPYSGVKTSILWLDKALAKQTNQIAFVKVGSDGFDLGAQRREIKQNELPEALAAITAYKASIINTTAFDEEGYYGLTLVEKSAIAENGDYNLSGERYKVTRDIDASVYLHASLGEVCDILNGSTPSKTDMSYWENGDIPWFTIDDLRRQGRVIRNTSQKITDKALNETSVKLLPEKTVLLCCTASVGEYAFAEIPLTTNQQFNGLIVKDAYSNRLLSKFLFYLSSAFKDELIRLSGQTSFNFVSVSTLKTLQIPLPPLAVQEEIVAEIESYQKIIDGARQVVENWRPRITIDPDWPTVELGSQFDILNGGTPSKQNEDYWQGVIPWVSPKDMKFDLIKDSIDKISETAIVESATKMVPENTLLIVVRSGILQHSLPIALTGVPVSFNQDINAIIPRKEGKVTTSFLFYYLRTMEQDLLNRGIKRGGTVHSFHSQFLKTLEIPLPEPSTQNKIVANIEQEKALVQGNQQLITLFEQKIKDRIARVWGEN